MIYGQRALKVLCAHFSCLDQNLLGDLKTATIGGCCEGNRLRIVAALQSEDAQNHCVEGRSLPKISFDRSNNSNKARPGVYNGSLSSL